MMIRNLMATTALTAMVAATGAYAQTTQPAGAPAGQPNQERQANQPQKQVRVTDGATVVIQADDQMTDVMLRIQRGGERGATDARRDEGATGMRQDADRRAAQQGGDVRDRRKMQAAKGPFSADDLMGASIYSRQDEQIGTISDILLTKEGDVDAVVVDIGGFLGMGGRTVAFGIDDIDMMSDGQDKVVAYTDFSRQQLENAPKYDKASWAENRDQQRMTRDMARKMPDQQPARTQAGATHVVAPGGTIIVQSDRDRFQLNFQVRRAGMGQAGVATGQDQRQVDAKMRAAPDERQTGAAPGQRQTGAASDQGQPQVVDAKELRANDLIGSTVYGANNENIGSVGDVLLNPTGGFEAVIVDVGGFLGIGTREVALALDEVEFRRERQDTLRIVTRYTRAQVEAAPVYDAATYKQQRGQRGVGGPQGTPGTQGTQGTAR